ncbi:MAG: coiled-coil domain-containing protein [Methylovirgula sp.]
MNREALESLDRETLIRLVLAQGEAIDRLNEIVARVAVFEAENTALRARVAELEAKLGLPPKTPGNSSTPPSQGRKASDTSASKPKGKAHSGAHRRLHPNPTNKLDVMANHCQHCGVDVSGRPQFVDSDLSGHASRYEAGQRSDFKPAGVPI